MNLIDKEQELEDAATKAYPLKETWNYSEERYYIPNKLGYDGFIDGANWQKEQSATNAIEFAEWLKNNYEALYLNGSFEWYKLDEKTFTSKELYELWQKTKEK